MPVGTLKFKESTSKFVVGDKGILHLDNNNFKFINNNGNVGTIIANVTGNVSGSSGSCTGNAVTATSSGSCTGNAVTATNLTSGNKTISGELTANKFIGYLQGNVSGSSGSCTGNAVTATSSGSCTGNAVTATRLETTKTISNISFDGSNNITLDNQYITNNAGYYNSLNGGTNINTSGNTINLDNTLTGLTEINATNFKGNVIGNSISLDSGNPIYNAGLRTHHIGNQGESLDLYAGSSTTAHMTLTATGKVGIGTTNPLSALHIVGLKVTKPSERGIHLGEDSVNGNNSIEICQNSGADGYIDFTTTTLNNDYNGRILYEHNSNSFIISTNSSEKVRINSSGYVGIGSNNPQFPLYVGITSGGHAVGSGSYLNSVTASHGDHNEFVSSTGQNHISISANSWIHSPGFYVTSDSRIKTNIVEIVDNEALIKFRQLKPCKYNYIDYIERGSDTVYGFIAQEVKEIMPYASSKLPSSECIPNVYKTGLYNNNVITFTETHNLDSDGTIKLILSNDKEITVPYTVVDTLKINIDVSELSDDEKPSNDLVQDEDGNDLVHNIFVYGTSVDDFHILNKDAIWTTATAALQEVDRIQQADAVKIQTLENKNTELENKVSTLETQLANVLTRLAALENN